MNEFTAKKLAEVEAFLKTSGVIVSRAGSAFADTQGTVAARLSELSHESVAGTIPEELQEVFTAKAEKTTAKLAKMMELYIGDEWGNPVEVLEWCSFFTGAAAAHCALASELDPELRGQLDNARASFEAALQEVIDGLRTTGAARRL